MTDLVKVVSKGSDWVTATAVNESESSMLMSKFSDIAQREFGYADTPKPWVFQGYRGQQYPGLKCGIRGADETCLILSGEVAQKYSIFLGGAISRVTRFDIQVTVGLSTLDRNYAQRCYTALEDIQTLGGKKRAIKLIKSSTGQTLYVGSRKSAVMLRLYDKSLDAGEPETGAYWRYEVEFKKEAAERAWQLFHVKHNREEYIASQVFKEFSIRDVLPRFESGSAVSAIETSARVSSVEGQLAWLHRCVSPVVVQLLNMGYEEEVLKSIKLRNIVKRREV